MIATVIIDTENVWIHGIEITDLILSQEGTLLIIEPNGNEREMEIDRITTILVTEDITTTALRETVKELERLRSVLLPHYEGKISEPDLEVIEKAKDALSGRGIE